MHLGMSRKVVTLHVRTVSGGEIAEIIGVDTDVVVVCTSFKKEPQAGKTGEMCVRVGMG